MYLFIFIYTYIKKLVYFKCKTPTLSESKCYKKTLFFNLTVAYVFDQLFKITNVYKEHLYN